MGYKDIICGIYCIENILDKSKYIGQSKNIKQRLCDHKRTLKNGTHFNLHLQRAYKKYGKENFRFYILEKCNQESLSDKEIFWIKKFIADDRKNGYNFRTGGTTGFVYGEEFRKNCQKRMFGNSYARGNKMKLESKQAMSNSRIGNKNRLGIQHTQEIKNKISASGQKRNFGNKFTGVRKKINKTYIVWQARIHKNNEEIYLGSFENELDAAKAYNDAALLYYGKDAKLNIILEKI